jgi:CRP/FNR family cyclic AMP-dependent transcriptional regulator
MDAVRRLAFLRGVPEEALQCLAAAARWRVLVPGEVVVDYGDASDDVFFVLEGALRVVVRSPAGEETILNELGPDDIFGELAAIDGIHRSANVTALVRSRLCEVPGPAFMQVVLGCPDTALRLLRLLSARLRVKDERMFEATVLPVRQRLLAELLRLSRDRGNGERRISPPPQQHVLAARIGLRRETVSREVAKLVRAGLLSTSRSAIILHRPEELRAEISFFLPKS